MTDKDTTERLARLPQWVQEHITNIQRQRDVAIRALNEFQDQQTPSAFYVDDGVSTGEQKGPSVKRLYVQTHKLTVEFKGVLLEIYTRPDERGIDLGWTDVKQGMSDVSMSPTSRNSVQLISKQNMR